MKTNNARRGICPKCGKEYIGVPALSRTDNETMICPDCGIRESLETLGLPVSEQDKILDVIHKHTAEMVQ